MKKIKHKKSLLALLVLGTVVIGLLIWKESAVAGTRWVPNYEKIPLADLETAVAEGDFDLVFQQTGLTEAGLARLAQGEAWDLDLFQRAFFLPGAEMSQAEASLAQLPFTTLPMRTFQNSIISWEEYLMDNQGNRGYYLPMIPLEEGDILLTPNSRCFGWRQGHAAMVVDGQAGLTLECLVLGKNSVELDWNLWRRFPAVMILRPTEESVIASAVEYARAYLMDVPYNLTVGLLFSKNLSQNQSVQGTHCAHLVWQAYAWTGLDLDSTGGAIVTPRDLAESTDLTLLQIWGIDPEKMWG